VQCESGAFACKVCAHEMEVISLNACVWESLWVKKKNLTCTLFLMVKIRKMGCKQPENRFNLGTKSCMKQLSSSTPFWSTFVSSKRQLHPLGHKLSHHVTISLGFKSQTTACVQQHAESPYRHKKCGLKSHYHLQLE